MLQNKSEMKSSLSKLQLHMKCSQTQRFVNSMMKAVEINFSTGTAIREMKRHIGTITILEALVDSTLNRKINRMRISKLRLTFSTRIEDRKIEETSGNNLTKIKNTISMRNQDQHKELVREQLFLYTFL